MSFKKILWDVFKDTIQMRPYQLGLMLSLITQTAFWVPIVIVNSQNFYPMGLILTVFPVFVLSVILYVFIIFDISFEEYRRVIRK